METPRVVLLVFILIFLFVSPETRSPLILQQNELYQLIGEERYAVDLLNKSRYGDFNPAESRWINVTGFREEDGYAWESLSQVQARARDMARPVFDILHTPQNVSSAQVETATPGKYENVTGIIRGQWIRSKIANGLTPPTLNLTALAPRVSYITEKFGRNITGTEGKLRIRLDERRSERLLSNQGTIREISAALTIIDDKSSGGGYEMTLHGVHDVTAGTILLSTTSPKFAGIFALPHLALSGINFHRARDLLSKTLTDTVKRQELDFTSLNPWSSSPENPSDMLFPTPRCEYVVYLYQYHTDLTSRELGSIEEELRYPTGASLPTAPLIKMSAIVFSPDCGFTLESKGPPDYPPQSGTHLNGPKMESYVRLVRRCVLAFALVTCAQIFLLMRQMKDTSTPSTRSRVSFYAIAVMAMGDGFACMGLMLASMLTDAVLVPLISTAFLAFLSVSFFGMRFLVDVWTVQAPERQERERREVATNSLVPAQATSIPPMNPNATPTDTDILPLPVTARRTLDTGATPVILPPDQDTAAAEAADEAPTLQTTIGSARQETGTIYTRFYVLMFSVGFLSLHSTTWPTPLRSIYAGFLSFVYLSFWLPQIYRNIMRNCRKALRWEFVIGQSLLRLTPFVYIYTFKDNVLFIGTDTYALFVLVAWVWLQMWALASQEVLGPRFFVPDGWAPPAYDYHPILHEDNDEESGASLPIGFTQANSSSTGTESSDAVERGKKVFDCAICMQNLEVPIVPSSSGNNTSVPGTNSEEQVPETNASPTPSTSIFSRRAYMVTPCRHVFHSACLEGWMRYRLQCPICRENLPPL